MLAQQAELRGRVGVGGGQHAAVAGRDHLARVEREAGDVAVRLADPLPAAVPADLAAERRRRRPRSPAARARRRWPASAAGRRACRSGGRARIARVRGVIAALDQRRGSMLNVAGSMSTNTGVAPQ